MRFRADLHTHSCLSPCGDLDNSPQRIAQLAAERGLNVVALTDHNTAANCPAFADACRRTGIHPLFGAETTSREEVHVLALFGDLEAALQWGAWVYARLPDIRHDPERLGDQVVVTADDEIIRFEERYLVTAIDADLTEIVRATHALGGISIPAHIDRSTTSISSQLGFLPDDPFDAVEVTRLPPAIDTRGLALTCASDAHYPADVGARWIAFDGDEPWDALRRALRDGALVRSIDR